MVEWYQLNWKGKSYIIISSPIIMWYMLFNIPIHMKKWMINKQWLKLFEGG
jgi:hypothetical protein